MEKTISVKVSGSEIEQSAVYGGVQGEGGSRQLVISFDEEWQGYSKTVTFLDAHMENPVKIFLNTSNANEDGSYTISIPSEPLATGGKFTYIIDGSISGAIMRSVQKELKVRYAPVVDSASLPSAITPSQAEQLNAAIDALEDDIPTALSELTGDSSHRVVTDAEIASWNAKSDFSGSYNDLTDKPVIADKATESQATEGTDDNTYMTPLKSKTQFNHLIASSLTNVPEIYTKESIEGMWAISGAKHGDMCIILSGNTSAQSIYRYYTKDINGSPLSKSQWVWLTDLSLFAPQEVLTLSGEGYSENLLTSADAVENFGGITDITEIEGGVRLTAYSEYAVNAPCSAWIELDSSYLGKKVKVSAHIKPLGGSEPVSIGIGFINPAYYTMYKDAGGAAEGDYSVVVNIPSEHPYESAGESKFGIFIKITSQVAERIVEVTNITLKEAESKADWDFSLGNTAKITLTQTLPLDILNVKSGDYGVLDVFGEGGITLPANSYAVPPDWDYLAPGEDQHYRYSFLYDGTKFDWNRSVRNDD